MNGRSVARVAAVCATTIALVIAGGAIGSVANASPKVPTGAQGSLSITFNPQVVQQLFKAGVFMYGASSVGVVRSDSGSLSAEIPLDGQWTGTPTSRIAMDPETGGIDIINGPAEASAGVGSIVVRRTGSTGRVMATVVGPFSMESGQFSQTLALFTMSSAKAARTRCGWTTQARLTLTPEGASVLNTLAKTTAFTPGIQTGSLDATVGSC